MSREQILDGSASVVVPTAGTAVPLSASRDIVKSINIQALDGNIDFIFVCNQVGTRLKSLQPGDSFEINGDNLDIGTAGYVDLAKIYIDAVVNGEGVSYAVLRQL